MIAHSAQRQRPAPRTARRLGRVPSGIAGLGPRAGPGPFARLRGNGASRPRPRQAPPRRRQEPRTAPAGTNARGQGPSAPRARGTTWELRLYVAGYTERSLRALDNLRRICEERLAGRYRLEVIDLLRRPELARGDQILAVPTLVRMFPQPVRRVIGDLANTERVLVGLDLREGASR